MTASIDIYRSVSVGTASPRHVILKLYETAIRNLDEADRILADNGNATEPLRKTHLIVGGLMSALDFEAGEMARRLLNLYLFVLDRVQTSSASGRSEGLADARKVLGTLLSAWQEMPPEASRPAGRSCDSSSLNLRG